MDEVDYSTCKVVVRGQTEPLWEGQMPAVPRVGENLILNDHHDLPVARVVREVEYDLIQAVVTLYTESLRPQF